LETKVTKEIYEFHVINQEVLDYIFLTDPFADKDGDGIVTGRFGEGLLETLGPFLGISGDEDDLTSQLFSFERYHRQYSQMASELTLEDAIAAFKHIFDLGIFEKK
jgi:hypothetical protein